MNPMAKVRVYLATCWYSEIIEDGIVVPSLDGVHWYDDYLLTICCFVHNYFVAPFVKQEGFPIKFLEHYDKDNHTEDQE